MSDDRLDIEASISRFLSYRDHSSGELRAKLKKRQFDTEQIDEVIERFIADGWINDTKFAEHQSQILADQGWGPRQIRAKLMKHGVESWMASETLDNLDVDWIANARARLQRKFGDISREQQPKAFRHLTYRGFTANTARRAIFDS